MSPRATYRVQFTKDFGFEHAARLAPYLAKLGVSHLYASPYFKARPGSTHGYNIVDHNELNPELGDRGAFEGMIAALRAAGLGQILDVVPNHVGIGGSGNPFWLDVLEWGPASPYAGWFDIDWLPDQPDLHNKVLVPFLDAQFGAALEDGAFSLRFEADLGAFAVWAYGTHKLPVSPAHYGDILGTRRPELERLGDAFANMAVWRPNERERADELKRELAALASEPDSTGAIEAELARFAGKAGELSSWHRLEALIAKQSWRAAHFRVAADDINYRRFFNIAELAGLRVELPAVFDHAHRLVFELMAQGAVTGLRIDHIDGLFDPRAYLQRLRDRAPCGDKRRPFYLVVEKILARDEPLRPDWPVDGTTGYDVANQLLGVLIDPAGEIGFTRAYADFVGETPSFDTILRASKTQIMNDEMASELARLARSADRIARQTSRTADFTRNILRRALREIVASFPVYRTYVEFEGDTTAGDRETITAAVADAKAQGGAIDPSVYEFLQGLMTGDMAAPNTGFSRTAVLRFAAKVQQYSGPVMAKGLEDTAFYRYNRFIALNEVGGDPRCFGLASADFHAANAARAAHWPRAMIGTSTHDTKRGEDARARLAALSECPDEWTVAVATWSGILNPATRPAPDRNDEYALYQTLLATIPFALLDPEPPDLPGWSAYADRVAGAMQKAMREAKQHTTWIAPNEAYEGAMSALIESALAGERASAFQAAFLPFARRIAALGVENSLVQTVLKHTLPGVPDLYWGTELWDLSMVDPDNRRPVDFELRTRLLDDVRDALAVDRRAALAAMMAQPADGRVKLALTTTLLDLRSNLPSLFEAGDYTPLAVTGPEADSLLAFVRRKGSNLLVVLAARFPARRRRQPISAETRIAWPADVGTWREVLTDATGSGHPRLPDLFSTFPAAVLVANDARLAPTMRPPTQTR